MSNWFLGVGICVGLAALLLLHLLQELSGVILGN